MLLSKEGKYFDSILNENECVKDYRRRSLKGVVVKLDLEKAYKKVDWNFLDVILARKGF